MMLLCWGMVERGEWESGRCVYHQDGKSNIGMFCAFVRLSFRLVIARVYIQYPKNPFPCQRRKRRKKKKYL